MFQKAILSAGLCLLLASPALAIEVNGLIVEPPEGYVAEAFDSSGSVYAATVAIRPPVGGPASSGYMGEYICAIQFFVFVADNPNASMTQAEHNAYRHDPKTIASMTELGGLIEPAVETATVRDIGWLEIGGVMPDRDGAALVTFEGSTPAGSVKMTCSPAAADFAAALPALRQIRDSIVMPARAP